MRNLWIVMVCGLAWAGIATGAESAAAAAGAPGDWWAQVQKNIAAEEYHVTWQDKTSLPEVAGAYQAPNRAHDLRTYFTEAGPRVVRRTAETPEWVWGLELVGMRNEPPDLQEIVADGNRIEYRRDGLTEWYVNSDKGLEQGFTIQEPDRNQTGWTGWKESMTILSILLILSKKKSYLLISPCAAI